MASIAQPPLMLYVLWHPQYALGQEVAKQLYDHFGSHRYRNFAGGAGIRVIFRSEVIGRGQIPLPIDWNDTGAVAVIALIDRTLASDPIWVEYVRGLAREADAMGFNKRVFPVAMDPNVLGIGIEEEAIRWDSWGGTDEERHQRLIRDITHEFNRMLRHRLEQIRRPDIPSSLESYLEKTQVVLSYSRHDPYGAPLAEQIRDWLHSNTALSSFLDVHDIPPGVSFASVIEHSITNGVMVALYTDSYSSREWCRREVLSAKRLNVPLLVVDCLQTIDNRAFPYLGNVPFLRMDPHAFNKIEQIAGGLLDEIFKDFLWKCRIEASLEAYPRTLFMARPPELASLSVLNFPMHGTEQSIVYPDPPLSTEEVALFAQIAPDVRLYSLAEWVVEQEG